MSEEDLSAIAPVAPAAWLYFVEKTKETTEILSVLSLGDKSSTVVIAPLLVDLTVDRDFVSTVRTPVSTYDGGVLTKVTSFCPFVLYFHNTLDILNELEDHGNVNKLCSETRRRFGIQEYSKLKKRKPTDIESLCEKIGISGKDVTGHVVFGNGVKEFLFAGQLIPCPEEAVSVQIGTLDTVKVPLYCPTLFCRDKGDDEDRVGLDVCDTDKFISERGFYMPEVSECMFYYIFTSWGQVLRVSDTKQLIQCGLQQFVNDTQQNVKLAPYKRYHGYMSQKLTVTERDQLMLIDATVSELGFSFASVYFDSVYELGPASIFSEWPIVREALDHADLMRRLKTFQLHLSTHVGALVFSSNSILYQYRLVYMTPTGKSSNVGSVHDSLLKAVRFFNGFTGMYEDVLTDARKTVKFSGVPVKDDRYSPYHLALVCGTSPQLFSQFIWFFNRMSVYNTGISGSDAIYNHVVSCSANLCEACGGRCCHSCYGTAFVRMATRLPSIPKQIRKEPFVVTLLSRFFADVDVMGSFGKRYGDPRDYPESAKQDDSSFCGGQGSVTGSVDRMKYIGQVLDYCKRNSIIDASTGEDILSIRGKKDFVNIISGLNQAIDDAVLKFITDVRRAGSGRDEIAATTQSFNLDLNPYGMCFSPLLTYQYYRVVFSLIQNLALINATAHVADNPLTGSQVSKWLHQHFQSICGAFGVTPLKKGFLNVKDTKNQKSVEFERLMDFRAYEASKKYVKNSVEIKSCKMSVQSLRSCRIKNRPISRVGKNSQVSVFFKKGALQRKNPVKGCLSFLLYRCHEKLFPGSDVSCLEFWQKVYQNALPKSVDIGVMEEFDALVKFLVSATDEYDESDVIDIQPDCVMNYVEYKFHNKFLSISGFRDYISTIQGLTTRLTAQSHVHFPYLLGESPKFSSVAEYIMHFKKMRLEGTESPQVSTVARESVFRNVFENRSLVTVSFALEKFASTMTTRDIFQFGQIGYFVGSGIERSLNVGCLGNQDYRYMRHRYVLATKLADVVIRKSKRDSVLFNADVVRGKVMSALDSSGLDCDPELLAVSEIMTGHDGDVPEYDDVLFYVDHQEHVARSIVSRIRSLVERGLTDFSIGHLREVCGNQDVVSADKRTYDFSALFAISEETEDSGFVMMNGEGDDACEDSDVPTKRSRL
uniref:Single-stranded DNA-binding protein n=1 Tax=Lemniscomys rat herpesvirus TaxID=3141920 RepID=A0AAU7E1F5_9VIRU